MTPKAKAVAYSESLSRDSIRGRLDSLRKGKWPNGKVPFGFDKIYVAPDGAEFRVPRRAPFTKGKKWDRYLVENKEEAKVVRWIYREFLDRDTSLRDLARQLTAPGPSGGGWNKNAVTEVLKNKIYCGYSYVGAGKSLREAHTHIEYEECAGALPPIVSVEDWQRAAAKLAKNAEEKRKVHPRKSSPLSGILYCGHCGHALGKHPRVNKRTGERTTAFVCQGAKCHQWGVTEAEVMPALIKHLHEAVGRAALEAQNARPPEEEPDDLSRKKAELVALESRLDQADLDWFGEPPGERKDRLKAKMVGLEEKRAELKRQIANLTVVEGNVTRSSQWWQSVLGQLVTLLPIEWGNPHTVRWPICQTGGMHLTPGTQVIDGQTIELDSQGQAWLHEDVEEPVRPAVLVESARLRNLLKSLDTKVTFWWGPKLVLDKKTKQPRKSAKFKVVKAVIEIGGEKAPLAGFEAGGAGRRRLNEEMPALAKGIPGRPLTSRGSTLPTAPSRRWRPQVPYRRATGRTGGYGYT